MEGQELVRQRAPAYDMEKTLEGNRKGERLRGLVSERERDERLSLRGGGA